MDSRQSLVVLAMVRLLSTDSGNDAPALVVYNVNSLIYDDFFFTIAATTTCQPPVGYTYKTSVDKYYKPVKDGVNWQTAKDACSSEGSMLVELKTAMDYQAIRPIFGMILISIMILLYTN